LSDNIQGDEELWSLYLEDFVCHYFSLDLNHELSEDYCIMLISQLRSSELVKSAKTVINRIFGLHAYVSTNGLKLTRAMPTLQKLRKLSVSAMSPEDVSVENACDMLYLSLEKSVKSEYSESELKNWYKLFMEVVSFFVNII
jgi:hypothetical protein